MADSSKIPKGWPIVPTEKWQVSIPKDLQLPGPGEVGSKENPLILGPAKFMGVSLLVTNGPAGPASLTTGSKGNFVYGASPIQAAKAELLKAQAFAEKSKGVVGPTGHKGPVGLPGILTPLTNTEKQFFTEHQNTPWEPEAMEELGKAGPSEDIYIPDPIGGDSGSNPYSGLSYESTPNKNENVFKKLWKQSGTATGRSNSSEPNVANTGKARAEKEELSIAEIIAGNKVRALIEKECGGKAHAMVPDEYDADAVFDVVKQVVRELLDKSNEVLLRKVSDTLAETIVEERKAWKQAHNSVTTDHYNFKVETQKWSKQISKDMAEMSVELHELKKDLVVARTEVKRLTTENRSLRVVGSLNKLPRKVKVD